MTRPPLPIIDWNRPVELKGAADDGPEPDGCTDPAGHAFVAEDGEVRCINPGCGKRL